MNGAESLLQTLLNGGVNVCFANPGTTEIQFISALEKVKGMRMVLGLFEGVCTGAADGYARMAGKPAATLLHLGPGLGNGIANLHNARRAHSPVVNIIGDHASYHLHYDTPLTSDIQTLAKNVSGWIRTAREAGGLPSDVAAAIVAARTPPGQIATLIVPADCAWSESLPPAPAPTVRVPPPADVRWIEDSASALRKGRSAALLLDGQSLLEPGLRLASRISQATGARIMTKRWISRLQRGAGRPVIMRLPYFPEKISEALQGISDLILVGATPPTSFFAYPNSPSELLPPDCQVHTLASPQENLLSSLENLADELGAPDSCEPVYELNRPSLPEGEVSPDKIWQAVVALMPEESIICDESITSGYGAEHWIAGAPSHDWLVNTGGSIGIGMPLAVGAAVACPKRKVFAMQSDGAGMYTLQSLWTMARENLDVVTVLFANQAYHILELELNRVGVTDPGLDLFRLFDLGDPDLDWVKLANGMGVPGVLATSAEAFNKSLEKGINASGPYLIEVRV
jgi:acetolactate synthase-1/2/3 large subunit